MRVLYIHQYFKTPDEGGANRSYYMSKALLKQGHQVTMLTTHNENSQKIRYIEGIEVVYLPVKYSNFYGFYARILSFLKFVKLGKQYLKNHHAYDKCIATSTPLTVGLIALWVKRKFNIPYVFEVRDLWPEAPIQMGVINNSLLKFTLRRVEKRIYKKAERIIALSPGMRNHIEKLVSDIPVDLIPNMADCNFFEKVDQKNENLVVQLGVRNKFVISYFGAVGPVNDLMSLIRCAEISKELPIRFLIMGEGIGLSDLKKYVQQQQLSNVFFIPYGNKEEVKDVLNVTDACYVSFLHKPVLRTNSPNKFFDAIASGKLIITNIQGWIRGLVEKKHIGIFADSDFPGEFKEKIIPFLDSPALLKQYQNTSRAVAEQFFSREELTSHFVQVIEGKIYKQEASVRSIFSLSA